MSHIVIVSQNTHTHTFTFTYTSTKHWQQTHRHSELGQFEAMETPLRGLDLWPLALLLMLERDPVLDTNLSSEQLWWGEGDGDTDPFREIESIVAKNFSENPWSCSLAFNRFAANWSLSSSNFTTFASRFSLSTLSWRQRRDTKSTYTVSTRYSKLLIPSVILVWLSGDLPDDSIDLTSCPPN